MILPGGFATLSSSAMPEATSGLGRSKLREPAPRRKIDVKRELSVDSVSVFTLIRTDTTLDHSQKAEKVYTTRSRKCICAYIASAEGLVSHPLYDFGGSKSLSE